MSKGYRYTLARDNPRTGHTEIVKTQDVFLGADVSHKEAIEVIRKIAEEKIQSIRYGVEEGIARYDDVVLHSIEYVERIWNHGDAV